VFSPDRVDSGYLDRLLSKCTEHLSLLAAPATIDRIYDLGAEAFDPICDSLRATVPCIVLDLPHQWSGWTKRTLIGADEILVVAEPDLANLRNAKNLLDLLKAARPNDHRPRLPQPRRHAQAARDQARQRCQDARGRPIASFSSRRTFRHCRQ
jgi:pilus assembly protein CpaE